MTIGCPGEPFGAPRPRTLRVFMLWSIFYTIPRWYCPRVCFGCATRMGGTSARCLGPAPASSHMWRTFCFSCRRHLLAYLQVRVKAQAPGPGPAPSPPGPRTPLGAAPRAPGPGPSRARSRAPGPCPCPGPGPGLGARAPGCLLIASPSPRIRDQSTQRDHGFRTHLRHKGVHSCAGLLKKQCVPVAACIQCANKYNWRDHHRQFRPGFFLG